MLSTRFRGGGSPCVPGTTSTAGLVAPRVVEPEELNGPLPGDLRAGDLRHGLAAEAHGVRPRQGHGGEDVAQVLPGRQERQDEIGWPSHLSGGRGQRIPRVRPSRQMDGSAPHDDMSARTASRASPLQVT